ncbi:hypothetical protein Xtri_01780 [Xanthomonas campestris pv. trichodesmae]|uniref:Uncharacterized protein n=2 Tax=Xanthomonas citri TaxID=346 RepID=A0AB33C9C4_XANCI|nr:hypothetical protein XcvCFBP7111P_05530 [Xanthomonas citri pv. vignicola]MBZ3921274.1 hypothetical protein [Xanthomonas campestris pv. trichodesmae]MBZ3926416.1 hypothetical protein [Xanthomonas citri pv. sesbaniae]
MQTLDAALHLILERQCIKRKIAIPCSQNVFKLGDEPLLRSSSVSLLIESGEHYIYQSRHEIELPFLPVHFHRIYCRLATQILAINFFDFTSKPVERALAQYLPLDQQIY